jgi:hypothetical protein
MKNIIILMFLSFIVATLGDGFEPIKTDIKIIEICEPTRFMRCP